MHNNCSQIYDSNIGLRKLSSDMTEMLENKVWKAVGYVSLFFFQFRSLNHTPQRAMNASIVRAPVQICDVNPEQCTDLS